MGSRALVHMALLIVAVACAVACTPPRSRAASAAEARNESEVAARAARAMRDDNILGLGSVARRPGFRVSRIVLVHSLVRDLDDYYLLEMTDDSSAFYGLAKVSLGGAVLSAAENSRVRVRSETEVRNALSKHGLDPSGAIQWVAVNGPAPLEALQPFTPLAEVQGGGPRRYVNHNLRAFIEDPGGWIPLQTTQGTIRVRPVE